MRDDPGRMRHRLTFQRLTTVPDEKCEQIETWEDYLTVHCSVGQYTGSEKVQARQEITESDMTFTVRCSRKLLKLNEEDFRIVFKGDVYDILFINDTYLAHEKLVISAKSEAAPKPLTTEGVERGLGGYAPIRNKEV